MGSVNVGNEAQCGEPIGVVFGPKGSLSSRSSDLMRASTTTSISTAIATPTPERNASPTRTEIARVANDSIKSGGDQPMSRLDRDQAAEAPSEDKDRRAARRSFVIACSFAHSRPARDQFRPFILAGDFRRHDSHLPNEAEQTIRCFTFAAQLGVRESYDPCHPTSKSRARRA